MSETETTTPKRKYTKRLMRSKYKFPTHIRMSGANKGELIIGHKEALRDIERERGHSLENWVARHTRYHWRWLKPSGVPAIAA